MSRYTPPGTGYRFPGGRSRPSWANGGGGSASDLTGSGGMSGAPSQQQIDQRYGAAPAIPDAPTLPSTPRNTYFTDDRLQMFEQMGADGPDSRGRDMLYSALQGGDFEVAPVDAMSDPFIRNLISASRAQGRQAGEAQGQQLMRQMGAGGYQAASLMGMQGETQGLQAGMQLGLEEGRFRTGVSERNAERSMQAMISLSQEDRASYDSQLAGQANLLNYLATASQDELARHGQELQRLALQFGMSMEQFNAAMGLRDQNQQMALREQAMRLEESLAQAQIAQAEQQMAQQDQQNTLLNEYLNPLPPGIMTGQAGRNWLQRRENIASALGMGGGSGGVIPPMPIAERNAIARQQNPFIWGGPTPGQFNPGGQPRPAPQDNRPPQAPVQGPQAPPAGGLPI